MTEPSNPDVRQERDVVPRAAIYAGAFVLAALLIAGWAAACVTNPGTTIHVGFARESASVKTPPREINTIDQALFEAHLPSIDLSQQQRALHSYTWVDRGHGIVRIPIERAMQLVAEHGHVE